ncbi:MAG TPA: hypothetical protein VFQ25_11840 [Ktedonobacterales bacterium]|nr:hypothetical protein [Ktedonobacterales bacterium]
MSGFERSDSPEFPEVHEAQEHDGQQWPEDFSPEERQFAAELRELFPIEDETLPPLFVQTLLDDELRAPLSKGYTRKLIYRVMRRLDLPLRPLTPRRGPLGLPEGMTLRALTEPARRAGAPVLAALSLLMALVVGSVYLATPSFAEGLRLLLGQSGAQQIDSYPTNVSKAIKRLGPLARQGAPMPVLWPGQALGPYAYIGMNLLDQQEWSNGQILDLQYALMEPGQSAQPEQTPAAVTKGGTGLLDIREFQLSSQYLAVLLAVQNGSATKTSVDGQPAVYVDGMWVVTQGGRQTWQRGTRSLLIFERDGVIFWITGDQRDGMTSYALTQVAAALRPTTLAALRPTRLSTRIAGVDPTAGLRAPLGANADVLDVIARGAGQNAPESKFVTFYLPTSSLLN